MHSSPSSDDRSSSNNSSPQHPQSRNSAAQLKAIATSDVFEVELSGVKFGFERRKAFGCVATVKEAQAAPTSLLDERGRARVGKLLDDNASLITTIVREVGAFSLENIRFEEDRPWHGTAGRKSHQLQGPHTDKDFPVFALGKTEFGQRPETLFAPASFCKNILLNGSLRIDVKSWLDRFEILTRDQDGNTESTQGDSDGLFELMREGKAPLKTLNDCFATAEHLLRGLQSEEALKPTPGLIERLWGGLTSILSSGKRETQEQSYEAQRPHLIGALEKLIADGHELSKKFPQAFAQHAFSYRWRDGTSALLFGYQGKPLEVHHFGAVSDSVTANAALIPIGIGGPNRPNQWESFGELGRYALPPVSK